MAISKEKVKLLQARIRKAIAVKKPARRRRIRQTLNNFTVIVTNAAGVPRDTTGWTAVLSRVGSQPRTVQFDDFGVAQFNITTLTTVSYTLRVRDGENVLQAQRNVPADVQAYVVRLTTLV